MTKVLKWFNNMLIFTNVNHTTHKNNIPMLKQQYVICITEMDKDIFNFSFTNLKIGEYVLFTMYLLWKFDMLSYSQNVVEILAVLSVSMIHLSIEPLNIGRTMRKISQQPSTTQKNPANFTLLQCTSINVRFLSLTFLKVLL